MVRATFSLDEATLAEIRRTAEKLRKPQSHVVREAVAEYAARELLEAIERLDRGVASRSATAVDAELREIRAARRRGGRRSA